MGVLLVCGRPLVFIGLFPESCCHSQPVFSALGFCWLKFNAETLRRVGHSRVNPSTLCLMGLSAAGAPLPSEKHPAAVTKKQKPR
jgi:hypothetical protein